MKIKLSESHFPLQLTSHSLLLFIVKTPGGCYCLQFSHSLLTTLISLCPHRSIKITNFQHGTMLHPMVKHPTYQLSLTQTIRPVNPPLKSSHSWLPGLHTLLVFFLLHWFFCLNLFYGSLLIFLTSNPGAPTYPRAQCSDLLSALASPSPLAAASKPNWYLQRLPLTPDLSIQISVQHLNSDVCKASQI